VLSIGLLALARFVVSKGWIWEKADGDGAREAYFYDIHGIAGITSTALLPELAYFRVTDPPAHVDIRVITVPKKDLKPDPAAVLYDEGFADAGFWLQIRTGEPTVVYASPLLERSPHVLYTNVVEPILRWTLVCKGYTLVHGACVSYQGKALLISAATDTGKTTTVLKSLSMYAFDFLGDDMVILRGDGRLLSYPKPLTISLHTLKAVPAAQLNLGERIRLQIQSRIHSRLGRRIGILFGNIRLPAATLNAYLQMLIPPPKFAIDRLIPGVSQVISAQLAYLVVIERGPERENILPKNQVYPILAKNIDDAYGFPPYPYIAESLSRRGTQDLRRLEKRLISRSIQNLPAVNLRRDDYAWWQRLPAVYHGELFGVPDPISGRYPTIPRQAAIDPGR
jgi:hypothetical protein